MRRASLERADRRVTRSIAVCLLAALALACDEPASPSPASTAVDPPARPAADELASDCALGPASTWIDDAPARGSLAVADRPEGALVVLAADSELVTRALSAEGQARGGERRASVGRLDALLALLPRGERSVLIGRGPCEESAHCLIALALDDRGSAGVPVAAALPESIRTVRRAASAAADAPIFVAWSTVGGHRGLERFVLAGEQLGRMRVPLGSEPASEEAPVEILGLAADGDRWAAIWRRGPTEDVRSHVYLTTADSHHDAHALHDALAIDAIELSGAAVSLVATFEFSRPHHLRLRAGRDEPEHARELARGAALPAPFRDHQRAELDADESGLWLQRRDAAGDPIGSRARVVAGAVQSAALARRGDALFVAWQQDGAVHGRLVRCPRMLTRATRRHHAPAHPRQPNNP